MGEELQNHDEQMKRFDILFTPNSYLRIDERAGFTQDKLAKLNGKVHSFSQT